MSLTMSITALCVFRNDKRLWVSVLALYLQCVYLSVLYLDHKILDHDIKAVSAPYTAILSMMCGAIRVINLNCVCPQLRCPNHSSCYSIRSDGAFGSEVLTAVRSLLGIKDWDSSSPNDPKHYSLVEHKHTALDTILNDAFNKCDIQSPQQLKFYVNEASYVWHTSTS